MDSRIGRTAVASQRLPKAKLGACAFEGRGRGVVQLEYPHEEGLHIPACREHRVTASRRRSTPCAVRGVHVVVELRQHAQGIGAPPELEESLDVVGLTWRDDRLPHPPPPDEAIGPLEWHDRRVGPASRHLELADDRRRETRQRLGSRAFDYCERLLDMSAGFHLTTERGWYPRQVEE